MSDPDHDEQDRDGWLHIANALRLRDPNWSEDGGKVVVVGFAGPDEVLALTSDLADSLLPGDRDQFDDIADRLRFTQQPGPDGFGRVSVVCPGSDVFVTSPDLDDHQVAQLRSLYRRALAQYHRQQIDPQEHLSDDEGGIVEPPSSRG